jgi:hypothetical protein
VVAFCHFVPSLFRACVLALQLPQTLSVHRSNWLKPKRRMSRSMRRPEAGDCCAPQRRALCLKSLFPQRNERYTRVCRYGTGIGNLSARGVTSNLQMPAQTWKPVPVTLSRAHFASPQIPNASKHLSQRTSRSSAAKFDLAVFLTVFVQTRKPLWLLAVIDSR